MSGKASGPSLATLWRLLLSPPAIHVSPPERLALVGCGQHGSLNQNGRYKRADRQERPGSNPPGKAIPTESNDAISHRNRTVGNYEPPQRGSMAEIGRVAFGSRPTRCCHSICSEAASILAAKFCRSFNLAIEWEFIRALEFSMFIKRAPARVEPRLSIVLAYWQRAVFFASHATVLRG